jgi:peptidoglycan/LPS O-acetylase OafA/YrhL
MVILYHCVPFVKSNLLRQTLLRGSFGVEMFFVISGFLITWLLLEEERKRGSFNLEMFYLRRLIRIQPPALTYLVCVAIFTLAGAVKTRVWDIVPCIFIFRNLTSGAEVTQHFWSLSIEEQFYLVWPILLYLLGSQRKRVLITGILIVFAPIWRQTNIIAAGGAMFVNSYRFDLKYDSLLIGCALALIRSNALGLTLMRVDVLQSRAATIAYIIVLAALLGGVLDMSVLRRLQILRPTLDSVAVALLINSVVDRPWILLNLPLTRWIGRISYSLYLWQQLALDGAFNGALPIRLLMLLGAASAGYYLIERTCNRIRSRLRDDGHLKATVFNEGMQTAVN